MKRILVVTDSIDANDSSGSKANVGMITSLVSAGFNVEVWHYTRREVGIEGAETYSIPEVKGSLMYLLSGGQRVLQRNTSLNLAPFLEKLFGFSFTFFNDVSSIRRFFRKRSIDADLIITLSKGASFRPHFAMLNFPELYSKWMAYIHDPFPFHLYPPPYAWVEPSHRQKEDFFRKVSERAAYSAFPSKLLMEWVGKFFPNFLHTGIVIPHQNTEVVKLPEVLSTRNKSRLTLVHAGNLMGGRSPEGLLKGLDIFLGETPQALSQITLILVGPAVNYNELVASYVEKWPDQIIFNDYMLPFEEALKLQNEASVNIIIESVSKISPFLPGKFPHCVAARRPILHLGPEHSEVTRLMGKNYPYTAPADDVKQISSILKELYQLWLIDPGSLVLDRPDLEHYLSSEYLRITLNQHLNKDIV